MRIAFIRSVDLNQAMPLLSKINEFSNNDLYLKLFYTDGLCDKDMFPGEHEKIDASISCEELIDKILEWKADVVISISLPDDNSLRDACIKEMLSEKYSIPMIMHPLESTAIMCNKWATSEFLRSKGYRVPKSFFIYGDLINNRGIKYKTYLDYLSIKASKITFPIIVKPLWDSMSCGIIMIENVDEFSKWLYNDAPRYDVLVEEFIYGELFGIEVVGTKGNYICQPLVKKCTDDSKNLFPFDHLRFGPFIKESYKINELKEMVISIANELQVCGSIDIELIYKDGMFYIIEINPRISGMTTLSSAVSNINTYQCLLEIATNIWNKEREIGGEFAAEFPIKNVSDDIINELKYRNDVFYINRFNYHNGTVQYKMILKARSAKECYLKMKELENSKGIVPKNIINELLEYISVL